jgi:hypothetical protein
MTRNLFILLLLLAGKVTGQNLKLSEPIDSTKTYRITLADGSHFIGKILEKNFDFILIKTESIAQVEIPINKIKALEEIETSNFQNGLYWFPNPNATRYLFGPSAFSLKKGEGYYQNTYLLLNSFNVGITDNISIGGGFELLSTIIFREPIFFITPKVSYKVSENFHAGGGALFLSMPGFSDNRTITGIGYGIGTYGNKNHNITGGIGWGSIDGEFSQNPIITVSGMTRLSKNVGLVSENWFVPVDSPGYYGVFSYGIRFFGEKLAVDLAFLNNRDIMRGIAIGIPYVDFVVKF